MTFLMGFCSASVVLAICVLTSGCTGRVSDRSRETAPGTVGASSSETPIYPPSHELAGSRVHCLMPQLFRGLWEQRREPETDYDLPVGPGDVLHVQVAELEEFEQLSVRVAGDGTIDLPLIGIMSVAGMNENRVQRKISQQVKEYVKHPRVHVFVSQYRSRTVAIMGMVARPGAYLLAGPSDSLLDIIGRAGGMTIGAAQTVILFPAEADTNIAGTHLASSANLACASPSVGQRALGEMTQGCRASSLQIATAMLNRSAGESSQGDAKAKGSPIVIDLTKPALAGCLDIPARPGDVVMVPAAGQVGVYGWVQKPGTFDVTPGMTVLGAISAAGGATFSANAEILRTSAEGERTVVPLDLSNVEDGSARDIAVEAGDLVLVRASALGMLPYVVSTLLNKFGSGMYFAAP
jgi:protein involved in polysaccharide export with SLBB domain